MPSTPGERISGLEKYSQRLPKFGIEVVHGVDLGAKELPNDLTVEDIVQSVIKHRLVVFRNQGRISEERQVEISRWFGPLESTFYRHPRSNHTDVFRVSNDENEGCRGVGRTGWHVDGSFQLAPFRYALYHIIECPRAGDTVFLPLSEFLSTLNDEQRARWERLYMCSDRRSQSVKPLIYSHPETGQDTMCFHLGMIAEFVVDYGTIHERRTSQNETKAILDEIEQAILSRKHLWYSHSWRPGDFIMSDNAALAHEASIETQYPPSAVGLRVMHRTTTHGHVPPKKGYKVDGSGHRIASNGQQ